MHDLFIRFLHPTLIVLLLVSGILPTSCANNQLSHQPKSIQQMKLLVTPDDPIVVQTLKNILNQPIPEINRSNFYLSLDEYLQDFNRIVDWVGSHVLDVSDQSVQGVPDYWQLPAETLELGTGDCEDYSILLCSLLRAYGVPTDQVYVAVGETSSDQDHAWLVEKYYKGIWRIIDRGNPIFADSLSDTHSTNLCFNEKDGFRGAPALAAGLYEFELSDSYYPLMSASGTGISVAFNGLASITYYSVLKAGQKVSASLEWLQSSVYSTYNPKIIYPWIIYIYDKYGEAVFSWNDTNTKKTVEFTAKTSGVYEIEVVKRDNLPRCARLILNPADWKIQLPTNIFHTPNTDILDVPIPDVPTPTKTTATTTSVPLLSREKLVQYMLDLINKDRTGANIPPVTLGNNSAAQSHAEDMLNNLFYSQWGTDGMNSSMRYTKAGGTGSAYENIYVANISWSGGAVSSFENTILSMLEQAETTLMSQGMFMSGSSGLTPMPVPLTLYQWNKKVNVGIAYNSEYLFLVLQFETENINFNQLPTIQNGILSFSGQNIPGVNIAEWIFVYYNSTPYNLNANQLNNAPWEGSGRFVALISETQSYYSGMSITSSSFQYNNPYAIPEDAPVQTLGSSITMNSQTVQIALLNTYASNWVDQGTTFSITVDLNQIVSRLGSGVYTVVVSGRSTIYEPNGFEIRPLFRYSIFVQ
jgi:predicted transglutaminase-like cysteine proteinase